MSNKKSETLSEKISKLLDSAPKVIDPEENIYPETAARVDSDEFDDDEFVNVESSKLRKQNIQLLEDGNERYKGKRCSRKSLETDDFSDLNEDSGESDNSYDDDQSAHKDTTKYDEESSDEGEEEEEEEEDKTVGSVDESEKEEEDSEDDRFQHMAEFDVSAEVAKGNCVKNQLNIWEKLLETIIQSRPCLIKANQLPQYDVYDEFKKSDEFKEKVGMVSSTLTKVLDKTLELQSLLLSKYPESKNLLSDKTPKRKIEEVDSNSDEEIPSDTENEESEKSDHTDSEAELPVRKRFKSINDYESEIQRRHELYTSYRNEVIKKWNDKTKMLSIKRKDSIPVITHIESVLRDKERLIKKTQQKRSHYEIIGYKKKSNSEEEDTHCTEIFDDDDFYHELLREFVDFKSTDSQTLVELSRQWVKLQSMRSKMKRKIDTRATKGRKIRYTVHNKLMSFMTPIYEYNNWNDESKSQLYKSLFGKGLISSTDNP